VTATVAEGAGAAAAPPAVVTETATLTALPPPVAVTTICPLCAGTVVSARRVNRVPVDVALLVVATTPAIGFCTWNVSGDLNPFPRFTVIRIVFTPAGFRATDFGDALRVNVPAGTAASADVVLTKLAAANTVATKPARRREGLELNK
jgi:hypothetical protein